MENEAIFRMTGELVGGALSDLFCLAACICFADPDGSGKREPTHNTKLDTEGPWSTGDAG